jgi:glutamine synthetase
VLDIEAKTLAEMVNTIIIPAAIEFQTQLADSLASLASLDSKKLVHLVSGALDDRTSLVESISADIYYIRVRIKEMGDLLHKAHAMELEKKTAFFFSTLKPVLEHIRKHVDELEALMPDELWHLPKYREMLFIA